MSNTKPPSLLYKYVSAKRSLTCLPEVGDGTLRATQPAALNDPFECHISTLLMDARRGRRTETREEIETFARALTNINPRKQVDASNVGRARKRYGSLFVRTLLAQQLSARFGIVSFSENPSHPLMWSHYTTDGSGFVIGYDSEMLRELAENANGRLSKVLYQRDPAGLGKYKEFKNPDNINRLLAMKSDHWKYEKEWRLVVELNHTIGTGKVDSLDQSINLLRVPNETVRDVFYTERTQTKHVRRLDQRLTSENNRYGGIAGQVGARKLELDGYSYEYTERDVQGDSDLFDMLFPSAN